MYENVQFFEGRTHYPDCIASSSTNEKLFPIKERIMSLQEVPTTSLVNTHLTQKEIRRLETEPVFFFIYNTDNYYHFLYDTLPYLLSYEMIRQEFPGVKLLMQSSTRSFYLFVEELLRMLNIDVQKDVKFVEEDTVYSKMWISESYTHGNHQNDPPHPSIYGLYENLKKIALKHENETPKKIYVSRRSWIHGDTSNMGTNYTLRRSLINEDAVVSLLKSKGYEEIFTEKMSMIEKINMFSNATHIVGAIGGGLSNCLFSSNSHLLALVSPTFLHVNERFIHSFRNVNVEYFNDTSHVEKDIFKRYMRIRSGDIIGEIEEVYEDKVLVYYSKERVAGWNSEKKYDRILLEKEKCHPLDSGLNSPWIVDLDKLALVVR